jgi:hypothetical protein
MASLMQAFDRYLGQRNMAPHRHLVPHGIHGRTCNTSTLDQMAPALPGVHSAAG